MIKTSQVKSKKYFVGSIILAKIYIHCSTILLHCTALYSKSVVILMFIGLEMLPKYIRLYFDMFVLQQSIFLFTEAEEIIELSYKLI